MKLITLAAVTLSTTSFVVGRNDNLSKSKDLKGCHDDPIPEKKSSMRYHGFNECDYYDSDCDSDCDSEYDLGYDCDCDYHYDSEYDSGYDEPSFHGYSHHKQSYDKSYASEEVENYHKVKKVQSERPYSSKISEYHKANGVSKDMRDYKSNKHLKGPGKKQHLNQNRQKILGSKSGSKNLGSIYSDFIDSLFGQTKHFRNYKRHILNEETYVNGVSKLAPTKTAISGIVAMGAMMLL